MKPLCNFKNLFLISYSYEDNSIEKFKNALQRIIRWVFSIIRSSLRLFGIYTHPYESSNNALSKNFPDLDITLLKKLVSIRRKFNNIELDISLFSKIEFFIETYIKYIIGKYYENKKIDK